LTIISNKKSSQSVSRILYPESSGRLSFIWISAHTETQAIYPSARTSHPYCADIHDIATPKRYGFSHRCKNGKLLPHLLTLTSFQRRLFSST